MHQRAQGKRKTPAADRPAGRFDYLRDPDQITRRSFALIRREAALEQLPPGLRGLAARLVHACAMPDIVGELAFSKDAAEAGRAALAAGAPVLVDARMVAQGIARARLPAGNQVVCTLNRAPVRNAASGTFPVALCAWRTDVASKEKKKKAWSLRIGPPIVPPYWFRRNGRFGVSLGLK